MENSTVLFKDYTSSDGFFCQYSATKAFHRMFKISMKKATDVVRYAVRNNYPMVDAIMIQQYELSSLGKPESSAIECDEEQEQIDHDNHMYECGLTSDGHDWLDC